MKEKFQEYLKKLIQNKKEELNNWQYILLEEDNGKIYHYFANKHFMYFIEFPVDNKDYSNPLEVLKEELEYTKYSTGIIYEKKDNKYIELAYYEKNK